MKIGIAQHGHFVVNSLNWEILQLSTEWCCIVSFILMKYSKSNIASAH